MTYALSWPLQEGLFALISGDPACDALLSGRVYDAAPHLGGEEPDGVYVTLGDEQTSDWSTASDAGAIHLVSMSIHSPGHGFAVAKQAAAAVCDAVLAGGLTLSRGRLVNARFVDARTRRAEADAHRRIDLRFRLTLEDTD